MLLAHGKLLPDSERPGVLARLEEEINGTRAEKTLAPEAVVAAVDALGRRLEAGEFDGLLRQYMPAGMSLEELLPLLSREALERKLAAELGPDPFTLTDHGASSSRRVPLGTLLHIAPGNQPGLPVYTVLEGLLTGNVNLLKLPRADKGLSLAALSLLCEAAPELSGFVYAFDLPSGRRGELQTLAGLADGIVTWGSDAAVEGVRRLAPPGCKLIEWGHRLSFAYISGFEDEAAELAALAGHIAATRQRLCSSCQVIFLDGPEPEEFCRKFLPILEARAAAGGPGMEALASLNGRTALLERVADGRAAGERVFRGRGCSVIFRPGRELELSPMEANVLVKALPRGELLPVLRRQKGHLQTAALLCPARERAELAGLLLRAGVTRVTRAGSMSAVFPGEGHDGEYPLLRYTRIVDVEK